MTTRNQQNWYFRVSKKLLSLPVTRIINSCRNYYYKLAESTGRHKRDIIVYRVEGARDSLQEAKQQFQTALEKFSELSHFDGGDLEWLYKQLAHQLKVSESRSNSVCQRIRAIERMGEALFDEWQLELRDYNNRSLRNRSQQTMKSTRKQYDKLIKAMRHAEKKIEPVLIAFRDQVLFLKHNLNAKAICSLHNELISVGIDIAVLITAMEKSIGEANLFMQTLVNQKALPAS